MKKNNLFKKIVALTLVATSVITTAQPIAAEIVKTEISNQQSSIYHQKMISEEGNQLAKDVYESLDDEAKEVFKKVIASDPELVKFHQEHVDKDYNPPKSSSRQRRAAWSDVQIAIDTLKNNLAGLNLPTAVRHTLLGIGAGGGFAVAEPTFVGEVIVGILGGVAAIGVFTYYWDDISHKWDDIKLAFEDAFAPLGRQVVNDLKDGFNNIQQKIESKLNKNDLPSDSEFDRFEDHYSKHGHEFGDMNGGKKPDKNKFWEMAKEFLNKTGRSITDRAHSARAGVRVKFCSKTMELMIYEESSQKILSYYRPKFESHAGAWDWLIAAQQYFNRITK